MEEKKLTKLKRQKRKRVPKSRRPEVDIASDAIIPGATSIQHVSPPASFTSYDTLPVEMVVTPIETVVKPDLPKTMVTIIRPRSIQKQSQSQEKLLKLLNLSRIRLRKLLIRWHPLQG